MPLFGVTPPTALLLLGLGLQPGAEGPPPAAPAPLEHVLPAAGGSGAASAPLGPLGLDAPARPPAETPRLRALAPGHVGLTLRPGPSLYWHLSRPSAGPLRLTLRSGSGATVLDLRLAGPFEAGVHGVDLARHGVALAPGVDHRWRVSLDDGGALAEGALQRRAASDDLAGRLAATPPARRPFLLAEHGIWYDAIDLLSRRIAEHPDDARARRQRAALLAQVGLGGLDPGPELRAR